jgi:hypothetical protein
MANDPNQDWTRTKAPHEDAQNVARHLRSSSLTVTTVDPIQASSTSSSTAELLETIKQMQAAIVELTNKVDALSKPHEEVSEAPNVPPLSTTEVDDIVTTRLLNYVAEQIRPAVISILHSGKATAYDFIDHDLKSESFGMFFPQEEIVKKVEDLTRAN